MAEFDGAALTYRVTNIEDKLVQNEKTHKEFFHRLEELGKDNIRTEERYATILEKLGKLDKLEARFELLADTKSDKWDKFKWLIVGSGAAGMVGYILNLILK